MQKIDTPEGRDSTREQGNVARREGKVLVPALLYIAGVPLSLVVVLWFFFFRG